MDDRKAAISSHHPFGRIGADAAPVAPGVRCSTDVEDKLAVPIPEQAERLPGNPSREQPVAVYCGDVQQVSEGFAIALRAMGVVAGVLQQDVRPPNTYQNREDD